MTIRSRLLAAVAIAILAAGPAVAEHQWGSYHWSKSGDKVVLNVRTAMNSQWNISYNKALADWNQSTVLELVDKGAASGVNTKKCNPIAGEILVCSDTYGFRGWLGVATIWLSGDHISQGTTQLNDSYYGLSTYDTPAWRSLVMCQEIGHDFGLDHQDEGFGPPNLGTCMDYTDDPTGSGAFLRANTSPNTHDYEQLVIMYTHNHDGGGGGGGGGGNCNPRSPKCNGQDAFTFREVGAPPRSSENSDTPGQSIAEWGRAIGYDGRGRPDRFLMDLGNGRRKLTHVFWVPGFRPAGSR